MLRIQCAWCLRMKERGGRPVGPALPIEAFASHGICTECARRYFSLSKGELALRVSSLPGRLIRRRRYHPPGMVGWRRSPRHQRRCPTMSTAGTIGEVAAPIRAEVARRARIVVGPGLLELQSDDGRALRTIIFERSSPQSKERARDMLASEARALGYIVVGECEEVMAIR